MVCHRYSGTAAGINVVVKRWAGRGLPFPQHPKVSSAWGGIWNRRTLPHCIEAEIVRPTGDKELLTWPAIPRGRF